MDHNYAKNNIDSNLDDEDEDLPLAKFIEKKCNGTKSATDLTNPKPASPPPTATTTAAVVKLKSESECDDDNDDDDFMDMSDDQLDYEDESKKYRWCVCDKGSLALFTTKTCDKCNSWYHLDCFEKPEDSKLSDRDIRNRDFVCFVCKGDKKLMEKYAKQLDIRKKNNQTVSYNNSNNGNDATSSESSSEEETTAKTVVSKKRPIEEPAKKASKSFKKVSYSSSSSSSSENEKEKQQKKKKTSVQEVKSDKKRIEELKSRIKPPNQTKQMSGNDLSFKLGRITTNKPATSKLQSKDAASKRMDATYKSIFNPAGDGAATTTVVKPVLKPTTSKAPAAANSSAPPARVMQPKPAILTHQEIRKRNVEILVNTFKEKLKDDEVNKKSDQELEDLCKRIEQEVNNFNYSVQNPMKYKHQMNKIRINLADKANDTFYVKILSGRIRPEDVARMESPAMASDKEQQKKEMENQKELTAIVEYNQELNAQKIKLKLKKSHKGIEFDF